MVILNITTLIPSPCSPRENNILLVTAQQHESRKDSIKHVFVRLLPYTPTILTRVSDKWKCYKKLAEAKGYSWDNRYIHVLALVSFKKDVWIRPFTNWLSYAIHKKRLMQLVLDNKVNIIHAHSIYTEGYLARRLSKDLNIPYVITTRGIQRFSLKPQARLNVLKAKSVISINNIHKSLADSILKNRKSHLMPHGIDDMFLLMNRKAGFSVPQIVTICRLLTMKNIERVFYALEKTKADFVYHIYGDGPDLLRLQDVLSGLSIKNKVKFMGFLPYENVPETLSNYDIFVMTSYPETLGRVYFEAMAVGLPVVGARNTGIDGYIQQGVSGYVVQHTDIDELHVVIDALLKDKILREEIGRRAKDMMVANYSWSSVIEKLHSIYKDIDS